MVNRDRDNWYASREARNVQRRPGGYSGDSDYGPGETGFVRGYEERRPDADRYGPDRQMDYGNEGGYGSYAGSRYPRMGREDWTTDDLGYYGDMSDRGYGDRTRGYARGAGSGYYPSDHPSYRGGYGRRRGEPEEDRGFLDRASDEVASWFGDDEASRRRERDSHRGKGPKGYKRSDSRIQEDANDRLADDGSVDASDIEVSVKDGEVTLSGFVTDRWEKRRAEDCVDGVSGVNHVQNNLRVRTSGEGQTQTSI